MTRKSNAAPLITGIAAAAAIVTATGTVSSSEHLMGHIRVERPGQLTPDEAQEVYEELAPAMAESYSNAGFAIIEGYQDWRRHNVAPYLSATHGNRYVNNYANRQAAGYERMEDGVVMAEGAVLAKDSITVTGDDRIIPAPLFVMEKLAAGASPETGDWRYLMVLPDGSLFGDSRGANTGRTAFCHDCHTAVSDADYLFFVPEEYRVAD